MRLLLLLTALFLSACGGNKLSDFTDTRQPTLDLFDYFDGRTVAYGIFVDRFGTLRREFKVVVDGRVTEDGALILDEDFTYDDGEKERRVWTITSTGPGRFEGRADNVVGTAQGEVSGNALNWRYKYDLTVGDDTWRVGFDDWLFLQPDGVLINRADVSRFGAKIGTVTITFLPTEPSASPR